MGGRLRSPEGGGQQRHERPADGERQQAAAQPQPERGAAKALEQLEVRLEPDREEEEEQPEAGERLARERHLRGGSEQQLARGRSEAAEQRGAEQHASQ